MEEVSGRATQAYANLHPFHPPTQQLRIRIVFCIPTATSMLRVQRIDLKNATLNFQLAWIKVSSLRS